MRSLSVVCWVDKGRWAKRSKFTDVVSRYHYAIVSLVLGIRRHQLCLAF